MLITRPTNVLLSVHLLLLTLAIRRNVWLLAPTIPMLTRQPVCAWLLQVAPIAHGETLLLRPVCLPVPSTITLTREAHTRFVF